MESRYRFELLRKDEVEEVYRASLRILEEIGVAFHHKGALSLLDRSGAEVDFKRGVAKLPSGLVEDRISKVPRLFTLHSRDLRKRVDIAVGKLHFSIGGSYARYVLDYRTGERRAATLRDMEKTVTVDDALDCVDFVSPPVMPLDVPPQMTQVKTAEAMLKNTTKPGMTFIIEPREAEYIFRMVEAVAGGGEALRKRPITEVVCEPTSPLSYSQEPLEKINECARRGIPVDIMPAPTCGMNAPVTIAGWIAQAFAEALAGAAYAQLVEEKTPVFLGFCAIVMNFKDGSINYDSPEAALGRALFVQLAHRVGLPASGGGGTDSKIPTIQTGFELAQGSLFSLLIGADRCGVSTSLDESATQAIEQHVISAEMVNSLKRILRGVSVAPDTLALDVIKEVGAGGSFLTHRHTFSHFRKEHWIPELSFRESWETLGRQGRKTIVDNAERKVAEILREHRPEPLDSDVQRELEAIVKEAEKELIK